MVTWQTVLASRWRAQKTLNELKLGERSAAGEPLTEERVVSHLAFFTNEGACARAKSCLQEQRFGVVMTKTPGGHQLSFTRLDSLVHAAVDRFSYDVIVTVCAHGGDYKGWTAPHKTNAPTASER